MAQSQAVTVRTDTSEEIQAMQALIQRWSANGWKVKNISQIVRSEGWTGLANVTYSTIVFEKEDSSFCPICNVAVNDMNRHRQWHSNRESGRTTSGP